MLDADDSGSITFDELKSGLRRLGSGLKDDEIQTLLEAVSCYYYKFNTSIFHYHINARKQSWVTPLARSLQKTL